MAVHQPVHKSGVYFITFTCYRWLPLISDTECYDTIFKFFDVLQSSNHSILGDVIMPNHVHLLVHYTGGDRDLNLEIGSGKRFIAYDIVKKLKEQQREDILLQLSKAVKAKDKSGGKKHEVWQKSFDVKECRTEKFILQKLIYIHNNPCTGKWKLVQRPIEYKWSSANFMKEMQRDM